MFALYFCFSSLYFGSLLGLFSNPPIACWANPPKAWPINFPRRFSKERLNFIFPFPIPVSNKVNVPPPAEFKIRQCPGCLSFWSCSAFLFASCSFFICSFLCSTCFLCALNATSLSFAACSSIFFSFSSSRFSFSSATFFRICSAATHSFCSFSDSSR